MRRVLAAILVLSMIWVVGLVAFAQRIERLTPAGEPPVADAVVALTGASDLRLEAAVRLLERGKGRRLLLSGVNKEATREDVLTVTGAVKPIYESLEGWSETTAGARSWSELPAQAVKYVRYIEELIGAPVAMLSTSPERLDTILVLDPFLD